MSNVKKALIGILFLGIVLSLATGVVRADSPENGWFVLLWVWSFGGYVQR